MLWICRQHQIGHSAGQDVAFAILDCDIECAVQDESRHPRERRLECVRAIAVRRMQRSPFVPFRAAGAPNIRNLECGELFCRVTNRFARYCVPARI